MPISWDYWLRYREIAADVDFVTIHMLPFWEDEPIRAENAAAHVIDIYKKVAAAFPGKNILIGEAGWPSKGRMREVSLPSRINQARFISELLDRAGREKIHVNVFEAYDEPWKRQWEGTVGAHWGLFDGDTRQIKHAVGSAVSNYPFWKLQLGAGLAFGICHIRRCVVDASAAAIAGRIGAVAGRGGVRDDRRDPAGAGRRKGVLRKLRHRRLV